MTPRVERVGELPPGFAALRRAAEAEGWRHLRVLQEDWESGTLRFDRPGEALFAAWRGTALAGIAGLSLDPYAPDDVTGRIRRLYVSPAHRGQGIARALLRAATTHAVAAGFRTVRVRAPASARGLYERCGFLPTVTRAATHLLPLG